MISATGVVPRTRKAAYHQISPTYCSARGIPAKARIPKATIAPKVSKGCRTRLGVRLARTSGEGVFVAIVSPQSELCVEQRQDGRSEEILEYRDAHEAPDDGRVHSLGHPFGAAACRHALVDADGG